MIRGTSAAAWLLAAFALPPLAGGQPAGSGAPKDPVAELASRLEPFLSALNGKDVRFHLKVDAEVPAGRRTEKATVELGRLDADSFVLAVEHPEYGIRLERTADRTVLAVPRHKVAFVGTGPAGGSDTLDPRGLGARIVGPGTAALPALAVLSSSPALAAGLLSSLAGLRTDDGAIWTSTAVQGARISFAAAPPACEVTAAGARARIEKLATPLAAAGVPPDFKVTAVDRTELERVLARGVRRALEVAAPSAYLVAPPREARQVPGGELRWVEDQRLVILRGTPAEVGEAHGKLLADEARRCADSVICLVGTVQSVRAGTWFPDDLRAAYRRVEPHLPADWKAEVDALADGSGLGREEARIANIFPELFHCSGFALFGRATAGGKLYHGRVLDYMTEIGLQDSAGTFVVAVKGKIPFASVGYAGFIGSVSGMNARQVSLGEMGGRGEGKWDGVPMATLMRRALEECSTLDEAKKLWSGSPRTCEYYYVFADGKIPDAVGVAATPEKVEFVKPGEAHPLLGDGIPDAVVLSAGDRLAELRRRVRENHGAIDAAKAMWLMTRPVAMRSNLHDVLFVPQDLVLYVSHADRKRIAAERPYVKFDLGEVLKVSGDPKP